MRYCWGCGFGDAAGTAADADTTAEADGVPVGAVSGDLGSDLEEGVTGDGADAGRTGLGAETPAMAEPRPSFCRLNASIFPVESRP